MQGKKERYEFQRGYRGVFAEIYFPKKVVHQGTIFNALREGYYENKVKDYLCLNIDTLLEELQDYPDLFDPDQYKFDKPIQGAIIIGPKEAKERIDKYRSPFKGWSLYQVDGVFFDEEDNLIEEATQVVRVIFRYESPLAQEAVSAGCKDVLRSMMFWTISYQGRLDDHIPWSRGELNRYLLHHEPWSNKKRAFAEQYFSVVAMKTQQWIDRDF